MLFCRKCYMDSQIDYLSVRLRFGVDYMNFKKTFLSVCLIVCLLVMAGICAGDANQTAFDSNFNKSDSKCCSFVI